MALLQLASVRKRKIGGYEVLLKKNLPNTLKCDFCQLPMRDAIQTCRGERSCESCYIDAKGTQDICPIDGEPITDEERYKDRYAIRQILLLECFCSNKERGCDWEGKLELQEKHDVECTFGTASCERCKGTFLRKNEEEHAMTECRFRSTKCTYCKKLLDGSLVEDHESICDKRPSDCPYKCGELVSLTGFYEHFTKCTMLGSGNVCPFQQLGCTYKPTSNMDLTQHLQANMIIHAALSVTAYKDVAMKNEEIKRELNNENVLCVELSKECDLMTSEKKEMASKLEKLEEKFREVEREGSTLDRQYGESMQEVEEGTRQMNLVVEDASLTDIETKYNELSERQRGIEQRLNDVAAAAGGAGNEDVNNKLVKVDQLERESAVLSANMADLELKLQLLENTCYTGRQVWKVDNLHFRMNQASIGKVTALHSAPCFQKRGGYKFCTRLYLNGDGMGKGTHTSLFFVLMKSEYDALLEWPFTQRVTFRLINPYDREQTIVESFVPDRNSSSFQRPTRDMNVAAGCPMFIRREQLNKFIVDDVLFIETTIGTA